jgi:hypothetical protein
VQRSSRAGVLASLRADLPLSTSYGNYMVPVSLNVGLLLH